MLRYLLLLLLPCLSHAASTLEHAITFPTGRFDTQTTADRDGTLVQAQWGGDCTLPAVNAISSCGPVWIARIDPATRSIRFATYLGTSDPSSPAFGLTLKMLKTDRAGNIYLLLSTTPGP